MKQFFFILTIFATTQFAHAQSWLTTGNSGTTPPTNYIGTNDAAALQFKVNKQPSGYIDNAAGKANTSFGYQTLTALTGKNNAAFGYKASSLNTTGKNNTSLGAYALYFNTSGYSNVAVGIGAIYKNDIQNNLVAIGDSALYNNGTGSTNTAIGSKALYTNTNGSSNSANGYQSLYSNASGSNNTANGYHTLYSNASGVSNTASGVSALVSNNTGNYNTATGVAALFYNVSGSYNTATGYNSLYHNSASYMTAAGYGALYANTTGTFNVATGTYSMYNNTIGYSNVSYGYSSLYANINGYYNTAIGTLALTSNTAGAANTAIGYRSLYYNASGYSNVAVGAFALYNNTVASNLVAIGDSALFNQTHNLYSGYDANTAIGSKSQYQNTNGYGNTSVGYQTMYGGAGIRSTAVGYRAMYSNASAECTAVGADALANNSGPSCTAIGSGAGYNLSIGGYCTFLGWLAEPGLVSELFNGAAFGYDAKVNDDNHIVVGDQFVTSIGGQVGWSSFSDERIKKNVKENVPGLAFINLLKPVTYHFNTAREKELLGIKNDTTNWRSKYDIEKINFTGLLAQAVDSAAKKINYDFSGVDKSKGVWGLRYTDFIMPLIKSVQELSKQNDSLEKQNKAQQNINANLQSQINELKEMIASVNQQSIASNPQVQFSPLYAASLEQNIPNPFNHSTTIAYSLPQIYSSAKIIVSNKAGVISKQINLSGKGKGIITIDASSLASGAYQYSLYIDGKPVDAKQMILAK